jgi:hypothetical protein
MPAVPSLRGALTGREPVFAISHRRPGGVRTLYGVHSPGRTHLLVFKNATFADALARGLVGYHIHHHEYPARDWNLDGKQIYDDVLFDTPEVTRALTPMDDISVDEIRLDLLMKKQRGSGVNYMLVYDVDEETGTMQSRNYRLNDKTDAAAWLGRVAKMTACPPGDIRDFPAAHSQKLLPPPARPRRRLDAPPDILPPCDSEQ